MAKAPRTKKRPPPPASNETRGAEFVTIGWMICTLTAFLCELVGGGIRLWGTLGSPQVAMGLLGNFLVFSSLIAAVMGLLLLGIALKVRQAPPPPGIVWFSVAVCLFPLLLVFW